MMEPCQRHSLKKLSSKIWSRRWQDRTRKLTMKKPQATLCMFSWAQILLTISKLFLTVRDCKMWVKWFKILRKASFGSWPLPSKCFMSKKNACQYQESSQIWLLLPSGTYNSNKSTKIKQRQTSQNWLKLLIKSFQTTVCLKITFLQKESSPSAKMHTSL
jgi:hypothetical protein